ncbi:MAG: ABC transporter permease [Planctomycetes bacterium]|nr:ABC transporter permease [Planctomycetota bacterium]
MHASNPHSQHPTNHDQPTTPSVLTAFWVLVVQSFQRHWHVKQMGWVSFGLLTLVVVSVGIVTARDRWGLPERPVRRDLSHRQIAEQQLLPGRYDTRRYDPTGQPPGVATITPAEIPSPFDPVKDGIQNLILSIPQAVMQSPKFLDDWAFMNFSRWVILGAYFGFVLPMFTLAYASAAFGTERESRSLVWVMTRPIPRSAIYTAKFLGTLPWCIVFGLGGFVVLCLAGGELGLRAMKMYWPAAVAGTIAFSAMFHLIGAIFRRPVVVGLVYVFFYEALVAALPGSLKLLSLTFYARSLMYNAATTAGYPTNLLDLSQPETTETAWIVLVIATTALTITGMWLFSKLEYRDDV